MTEEKYKIEITYIQGWTRKTPGSNSGFILGWTAKGMGFGQLSVKMNDDGSVEMDTELMTPGFVRACFDALIAAANLEEPKA